MMAVRGGAALAHQKGGKGRAPLLVSRVTDEPTFVISTCNWLPSLQSEGCRHVLLCLLHIVMSCSRTLLQTYHPLKFLPSGGDFMANAQNVTEFIFLGLFSNQLVQKVCFVMFLLLYTAIVLGNFLIVLTVMSSRSLGSPMYFFLSYLSFVEICYASTTAPKLISDLLAERKAIPLWGCMTQVFFTHFFGGIEMFLPTVMAYDRYVAICKPLSYTTIMNRQACAFLVGAAWVGGFVHSLAQILLIFHLPFCGPNVIDHYLCDVLPLPKLACSDTVLIGLLIVANGGTLSVISFVVLLASYVVILLHLRTRSSAGRRKALSTCGSHVTVVTLFFGPCIFIYLRPSTTLSADKMVAVFYTVITPLLNPVIYSLRNAEVKKAVKRLWVRAMKLEER
ncbi:olfactory receptor 4X2-like isoform X1 [Bubalus kerabau]|uniref:olfactory receptor 4X2-like isoform X1 n=1 Tax=Bubalus carabanensis TaxID=3119969 RepID=UPI00244E8C88|nr:olfactory receptor 4X2-like isoform X1 [Bubalus carabanensis]